MNYKVNVVSGYAYDVSVSTKRPTALLKQLRDVDTTTAQNNYVMIYDSVSNTYKFIPPSQLLDLADGINDDALDYGTY